MNQIFLERLSSSQDYLASMKTHFLNSILTRFAIGASAISVHLVAKVPFLHHWILLLNLILLMNYLRLVGKEYQSVKDNFYMNQSAKLNI